MKQLLKYILSQMLEYQKQAETKHSIGIALISGLAVLLINFTSSSFLIVKVGSVVGLGLCVLALIISFSAVKAKTVKREDYIRIDENINYMYYKDIHNFMPGQYLQSLAHRYDFPKNYLPDNFELDLAKSILSSAQRVYSKNRLFNISQTLLYFSLILLFACGVVGGLYGQFW